MKFLVVTFFILFSSILGSSPAQDANRIVAQVNGDVITSQDVKRYAYNTALDADDPYTYGTILEHLIQERLIIQRAKRDGLVISESWVEGKVEQLKSAYKTREEFDRFLVQEGLTLSALKERIREGMFVRQTIERYVYSRVNVSPKEITDYYLLHRDEYSALSTFVCWVAKDTQKSVLDAIGEEIGTQGFESTLEGHPDAFFKMESEENSLKDEVRDVVITLRAGEFKITSIDGSYYLIYLKEIIPPRKRSLDEVKDEIHGILWEEEFQAQFNKWIQELKDTTVIKIYN